MFHFFKSIATIFKSFFISIRSLTVTFLSEANEQSVEEIGENVIEAGSEATRAYKLYTFDLFKKKYYCPHRK